MAIVALILYYNVNVEKFEMDFWFNVEEDGSLKSKFTPENYNLNNTK